MSKLKTELDKLRPEIRIPKGFRLEPRLWRAIRKAATKHKCTESEIVRAALAAHLGPYLEVA